MAESVQDLLDQVREQLDEFNSVSITDQDIVNNLNRGQTHLMRLISRRIDWLQLTQTDITTVGGQQNYSMPRDIFSRRLEMVEIEINKVAWRIKHISYKDRSPYVTTSLVTRPYYYDIVGREFRLYPVPQGGLKIKLHYSKTPAKLVIPQGRINSVNTTNNYIYVDSVGSNLSTESDLRSSYVNIVDWRTGQVKQTLQIASIDSGTGQIKFKNSGLTRTSVLDRQVSTALSTEVNPDDYVSLVQGTAVSQLPQAYQDYLIQHATVALKRRTREPNSDDYAALQDIEKHIKKDLYGREQHGRIRKASSALSRSTGNTLRRIFS